MSELELAQQSEVGHSSALSRMELGEVLDERTPFRIAPKVESVKKPQFGLTAGRLFDAALHCWKLALPAGLILAAAGFGIAWATYTPKYTATATMKLESPNADSITKEQFQNTQPIRIKQRGLLLKVLNSPEVLRLASVRGSKDSVLWLKKNLQAGFNSGTAYFYLSLTGEDSDDTKIIVDETMKHFMEQHLREVQYDRITKYESILKDIQTIEEEKEKKRAEFDLPGDPDVQTLPLKQRLAQERHSALFKDLLAVEKGISDKEAERDVLAKKLTLLATEPVPVSLVNQYLNKHPAVQKLQSEIDEWRSKLEKEMEFRPSPSAPLMKLVEKIKSAEASLAKTKSELQTEAETKVREERPVSLKAAIELGRLDLEFFAQRRTSLMGKLAEAAEEVIRSERQKELADQWRKEFKEKEPILQNWKKQKESLAAEIRANRPTATELTSAEIPLGNQTSFVSFATMYSLVGFFLGFLGVSFFEARVCRVHKAAEVQRDLGIVTLAAVPTYGDSRLRKYGRSPSREIATSGDMFSEAVNGLCVTMLCDDRLGAKSTIMITSASEGEGKTLLATQLSVSFSQAGRKTLLLDCDFRHPRCHERVGLSAGPGLSEILRGEVEIGAALQTLPNSDSHFLSAGVYDRQVIRSLSNGGFAALLGQLRLDYDCIVIDSAPTLVVPDGLMIGKLVDGVILVVRSKVSKAHSVFSVYEQLRGLRIPILGAVLNGTHRHASSYYANSGR